MPFNSTTDIGYYGDDSLHGDYQYTLLEDIINDYIAGQHQDDYSAGTPRYKILIHAKKAVREMFFDVMQEVRYIEMELSPALTITLPQDYVTFVRISWVDKDGLLHPMALDSRMSLATAYLQDNNYDFLYDSDGYVLQGNGVRDQAGSETNSVSRRMFCGNGGFNPNVPLSVVFMNGRFNIDKTNGYIQFGGEVFGSNIVLEYISDGLFTGQAESIQNSEETGRTEAGIRIHKFAEQAIHNYISYALIQNRRNVPGYAVKMAKDNYDNAKRLAKRRINALRKTDLLQAMRGSSKWIKS